MAVTKKKAVGTATIDVELVVIRTGTTGSETELGIDTANKVGVEPQIETQDGVKLMKLGRLLAQKLPVETITSHVITLTDNLFSLDVVLILQGGTVSGTGDTLTYTPPVSGSNEKGKIFEMDVYSAIYDTAGKIVRYEKITYPNCQGTPIAMSMEDGVFRISEYKINSAPVAGQPPYKIAHIATLPEFTVSPASQSMEGGEPMPMMGEQMVEENNTPAVRTTALKTK